LGGNSNRGLSRSTRHLEKDPPRRGEGKLENSKGDGKKEALLDFRKALDGATEGEKRLLSGVTDE